MCEISYFMKLLEISVNSCSYYFTRGLREITKIPRHMLCYQILHGHRDTTIASCFVHRSDDSTRGNQLKLYKCYCTVDVTKHYSADRVVSVWNSLPDTVVTAPSLLCFRHQLAKFDLSIVFVLILNF